VNCVGALTVGELLGIEPDAVAHVGLYDAGSEPTSKPRSTSATRAPRLARGALDAFRRDAQAGARDEDIVRAAASAGLHVSVAQVRRWRLGRGIRHARARPTTRARTTALAMAVFGAPFEPVITRVKSVVDGRFDPPRYVVREQLDYGVFARAVRLLRDAGLATNTIASGIGVREVDVERAEKIARRT
jgi:hypothetical protein